MTLEMFRAITPYLLTLIAIIQAGMGFFLAHILKKIEWLERKMCAEQDRNHDKFIKAEAFYHAAGKTDQLIGEIFEQLKELNAVVNALAAELKMRRNGD